MIDRQLASFLEEGLSIHIGARNEHLQASGARAAAVTIEPDGLHAVIYVLATRSAAHSSAERRR